MSSLDFPNPNGPDKQDEEDYMNMIIEEPTQPKQKETYTQRRIRKERESETRGRVKSKAEREAVERSAREAALSKSMLLDPASASNKGLAMMAKMGFKPGVALGGKNNAGAMTEPIGIYMKDDRGGIGLDTLKKRKFRDEVQRNAKRVKEEQGDYRERLRNTRERARQEGQFQSAMRVAERMTGEKEEEQALKAGSDSADVKNAPLLMISSKPLKQINVLWRDLIRKRELKERDEKMRHDLQQSKSRLPTYEDSNEDIDYKLALGRMELQHTLVVDMEEDDPELDAFNELEPQERLGKIVKYLRETHFYCFWCKYTYPDEKLDGCPGFSEEDHD